jgi:ABC-type multidrug transport system fused ATPase/permease subunit
MIDTITKVLGLLTPHERMRVYFQFGLMVVIALLEIAGIASILPFMAVVSSPGIIQENVWLRQAYQFLRFANPQAFLMFLGMLVLGLLVLGNLLKSLYSMISLRNDNKLFCNLASRLLASYMARPYEFFLKTNTAEMAKNVLSEAGSFVFGVVNPGKEILSNAFLCIVILALLILVDPFMVVAIVVILGGAYGTIFLGVRRRLAKMGKEQALANFMKFKAAGEALASIKDLKILGRERVFLERFYVHAVLHARHNATVGTISVIPRYALETIAFGGILGIVLFYLRAEGEVGKIVPILSIYAFSGYKLMPAIQQLFANFSVVHVNLPALDMLYLNIQRGQKGYDSNAILPDNHHLQPLPFTRDITLRDLTFRFSGSLEPTIKGLNLTIIPQTSIGIVGPTGSGKTTLIDLVLGLLNPTSGQLLVDGVEITGENLARWQRNLGYVPQHIYLSDDTMTNNIAFGIPPKEIDMDAVMRAARIANLYDFVTKELPDGFQTRIGERGIRLSGGQRQRIGIARALYHDPAVLIMDEATSALDGITEQAVMEALCALAGKKTVIMIAHRFTTVKDCDVVYVLDRGVVVDQGTYDELLESSTWFQAAARKEA